MTAAKTTPEDIDAELAELDAAAAAAKAERDRVAARAAAIRSAGDAARQAATVAELRRPYATVPKAARQARDAAHDALMATASAPKLDVDKLRTAFILRQERDAECATGIALLLDEADPLPPSGPLGAVRRRPPASQPRYDTETWSAFLDNTIQQSALRAAARKRSARATELEQIGDSAEQQTREQAARSADGHLAVDQPETMLERFNRIADERVTPEVVAADVEANPDGTDEKAHRAVLRRRVLDDLLADERDQDVDE